MSRKVGGFVGYMSNMTPEQIADHYDETTGAYRKERMFRRRQEKMATLEERWPNTEGIGNVKKRDA